MTFELLVENSIRYILTPAAFLLIGLAVVFFLIGIVKFMFSAGDAEKRKEGRNMMIYGVIGMFVMISLWGLVNLLSETFDLDNRLPYDLPGFGGRSSAPFSDRSRYNYGLLPSESSDADQSGWEEYNGDNSESFQDTYNRVNR